LQVLYARSAAERRTPKNEHISTALTLSKRSEPERHHPIATHELKRGALGANERCTELAGCESASTSRGCDMQERCGHNA